MGARVVDGIADPIHVGEGDPLVPGVHHCALSGLQPIGVRDFDIRRKSSVESLSVRCLWPLRRVVTPRPRIWSRSRNDRCPHVVHCHAASYLRGLAYGTR